MKYEIHAIQTFYNGTMFRSRLEARWAAMFDILSWSWTYEPTDFSGWIPDFAIHGDTLVYAEVKPVDRFPRDVATKIDDSGCDSEALILGMKCPIVSKWHAAPCIGWLGDKSCPDGRAWDLAAFGQWDGADKIGFCHSTMEFSDRISGKYDGGCFGAGPEVAHSLIEKLWRQAGTITRWDAR